MARRRRRRGRPKRILRTLGQAAFWIGMALLVGMVIANAVAIVVATVRQGRTIYEQTEHE